MGYLINLYKRIEKANQELYKDANAVHLLHGFSTTAKMTPLEIINGVASSIYHDNLTHNSKLDNQIFILKPFISSFDETFEKVKRYIKLIRKTLREIKEECDFFEPKLYADKLTKLAGIFFENMAQDTLPIKSYKLYLTRIDNI